MNIPLQVKLTSLTLAKTSPQPVKRQETLSQSRIFSEEIEVKEDYRSLPYEIVVYPGEITEVAIQVENLTSHFIVFHSILEGDYPKQWYKIVRTDDKFFPFVLLGLTRAKLYSLFLIVLALNSDNILLYPREKIDLIIQWKIPKDFFESQDHIWQNQPLKLDYSGKIINFYQLSLGHNPALLLFLLILLQNRIYPFWSLFIQKFITEQHKDLKINLYVRPDSLYLNFLPEIYRQIDFLGRFINIFEQTFEPDVNILNTLWGYFNPMLTSESFLPFLSHWVGWKLTPALSLGQQRSLVRRGIELYKLRGTLQGLRLYLHLYTGLPLDEMLPESEKHISIQECFGERFTIGQTQIGHQALIGGGQPYHFKVRLISFANQYIDENLIREIIEQEKPAFCTYELTLINS